MGQPGQGGVAMLQALLPFIVIIGIFYFLLILPNSRKEKQRREMLDGLKRGDKVITIGGVIGTVEEVKGKIIALKISESVTVDVIRNAIAQLYKAEK